MRAFRKVVGLVGLLALISCKKDPAAEMPAGPAAPAQASVDEIDALWALAPTDTAFGLVVSPRGLAMAESAASTIDAFVASAPELAKLAVPIQDELRKAIGTTAPKRAELGLATDHGLAVFLVGRGEVLVLPVADRDKFLVAVHGKKGIDSDELLEMTCKPLQGRYVCIDRGMNVALGGGGLDATRKVMTARGDIETADKNDDGTGFAAAIQLASGAMVARWWGTGIEPRMLALLGKSARPPDGAEVLAGFGALDVSAIVPNIPALPLVSGVTASQLATSVAGQVTFAAPPGGFDPGVRVPLSDPAPAKALVGHCDEIPSLGSVGATVSAGNCHIKLPQGDLAFDAWVDGKELRLGQRNASAAAPLTPTPFARELASGEWGLVLFGRGIAVDTKGAPDFSALLKDNPYSTAVRRVLPLINELGLALRKEGTTLQLTFGVRTAWANPDDVVKRLLAITPEQIAAGKGGELSKAIADAAPGSLFAQDLKAGAGGAVGMISAFAAVTGVAIPAAMDSMKRSKKTEAELQLNRLGKNAKRLFYETGAFPKGSAGLTPADDCCRAHSAGSPGRCPSSAKDWEAPAWQALDFDIREPTLYRYSYESDGHTFVARAVGDLDCDGTPATYELRGSVENGEPKVALTKPAAGTY